MPKNKKYIPALRFNWLTYFYDPFMKFTGAYKKFNNTLLQQANVRDNDAVLDFGCGTGALAITIKEEVPNSMVYGIDIDPSILKIAQKKVKKSGYKLHLEIYDGTTLPYKDEMFDKVLSSLVFHHLARGQKISALQQIYRVLKHDGELYILDFGKAKNIIMRGLFLPIQLFDGFASTSDNVKGLLPRMMTKVGFDKVKEQKQIMTPLGSISLYKAIKK